MGYGPIRERILESRKEDLRQSMGKENYDKLMKEAKSFWKSPAGKAAIRDAVPKYQDP